MQKPFLLPVALAIASFMRAAPLFSDSPMILPGSSNAVAEPYEGMQCGDVSTRDALDIAGKFVTPDGFPSGLGSVQIYSAAGGHRIKKVAADGSFHDLFPNAKNFSQFKIRPLIKGIAAERLPLEHINGRTSQGIYVVRPLSHVPKHELAEITVQLVSTNPEIAIAGREIELGWGGIENKLSDSLGQVSFSVFPEEYCVSIRNQAGLKDSSVCSINLKAGEKKLVKLHVIPYLEEKKQARRELEQSLIRVLTTDSQDELISFLDNFKQSGLALDGQVAIIAGKVVVDGGKPPSQYLLNVYKGAGYNPAFGVYTTPSGLFANIFDGPQVKEASVRIFAAQVASEQIKGPHIIDGVSFGEYHFRALSVVPTEELGLVRASVSHDGCLISNEFTVMTNVLSFGDKIALKDMLDFEMQLYPGSYTFVIDDAQGCKRSAVSITVVRGDTVSVNLLLEGT